MVDTLLRGPTGRALTKGLEMTHVEQRCYTLLRGPPLSEKLVARPGGWRGLVEGDFRVV